MSIGRKDMFNLYMGCIPFSSEEEPLLAYFSQFGRIDKIVLKRRKNGRCCGFWYIRCQDLETLENILRSKPHNVYDREIIVEKVLKNKDRRKKDQELNKRRVFVKNTSQDSISDEEIRSLFSTFGEIVRLSIHRQPLSDAQKQLRGSLGSRFEGQVTYKTE